MNFFYTILLLFVLTISACNSEKEKTSSKLNKQQSKNSQVTIPKECGILTIKGIGTDSFFHNYIKFLNKLDCHDPKSIGLAKKKLLSQLRTTDTCKADTMIYIFDNYYGLVLDTLNSILIYETNLYNALATSEGNKKLAKKYRPFYNSLIQNGFKLIYPEGILEIEQDRNILNDFYPYLSERMKAYMKQINHETKEWFQSDAAIIIDEKEFLHRILWWEKFAYQNPEFLYSEDCIHKRKYYLHYSLYGMDNTSPLDDIEGTLNPYFQSLYELAY